MDVFFRVNQYAARSGGKEQVDEDLLGSLAPLEDYLLRSQEVITVRGKVKYHTILVTCEYHTILVTCALL